MGVVYIYPEFRNSGKGEERVAVSSWGGREVGHILQRGGGGV